MNSFKGFSNFSDGLKEIVEVVEKPTKNLPIKSATDRRKVKVRKQVMNDPIFEKFWNSIKCKTTYSVDYDSEELVQNCIKAFNESLTLIPSLFNKYISNGCPPELNGVIALKNIAILISLKHDVNL